ncbi:hypothetical protein [Cognatishimia sp. MH4019]|uniref:hypothetical protein n=1 Tax=Cognatishimia sp. MH4019 TaxID=2854030 RepID=UPI001CD4E289|nr:hypothetical protein [Cognatishimia sp. MH4019]
MTRIPLWLALAGATVTLSACQSVAPEEPTIFEYTSPEISGLMPVRAFPNPDDVCQLLGDSTATAALEEDGRRLIACPKHEKGAMEDRRKQGARVVANATHWVILSISERRVR